MKKMGRSSSCCCSDCGESVFCSCSRYICKEILWMICVELPKCIIKSACSHVCGYISFFALLALLGYFFSPVRTFESFSIENLTNAALEKFESTLTVQYLRGTGRGESQNNNNNNNNITSSPPVSSG
jgi:hypothetical protein